MQPEGCLCGNFQIIWYLLLGFWDFGISFSETADIGNQNAGGRESKRISDKSMCMFWPFDVFRCFVFKQYIRGGRR